MVKDLNARYYQSETMAYIMVGLSLLYKFFDLSIDKFFEKNIIKNIDSKYYIYIYVIVLILVFIRIRLEYYQSTEDSKINVLNKLRYGIIEILLLISISFFYKDMTINTKLEDVKIYYFLVYILWGVAISFLLILIINAILMIKSKKEIKDETTRKYPVVTKAICFLLIPILLLIIICYYMYTLNVPIEGRRVGNGLLLITIIIFIINDLIKFTWIKDKDGKIMLKKMKEAANMHDYNHYLCDMMEKDEHKEEIKKMKIKDELAPKELQENLSNYYTSSEFKENYSITLNEEIKLKMYNKEINRIENNSRNSGFTVDDSDKNKKIEIILTRKDISEKKSISLLEFYKLLEKNIAEKNCDIEEINMDEEIKKAITYLVFKEDREKNKISLYDIALLNDKETVSELIKDGYDVNEQVNSGWSALLIAVAQGYEEMTKLLLEKGANPNLGNILKRRPLTFGARYGNLKICNILIEYGADLNFQDDIGDTPLMKAIEFRNEEVCKSLIRKGTDLEIKNLKGKTALDLAYKNGLGNIAKEINYRKKG